MLSERPYKGQTLKILAPQELAGNEGIVKSTLVPYQPSAGYYDDPVPQPPLNSWSVSLEMPNGEELDISVRDLVEIDPRLYHIEKAIAQAVQIRSRILRDPDDGTPYLHHNFYDHTVKAFDEYRNKADLDLQSINKKSVSHVRMAGRMLRAADKLREQVRVRETKRGSTSYLGKNIGQALKAFDKIAQETGYADFGERDKS